MIDTHLGGHNNITNTDYKLLKFIKEKFQIQSMLDIGCGPGGMSEIAKDLNIEWLGIDGDKNLKLYNKKIKIHDFTISKYEVDKNFDLIWSIEFLEHLEEKCLNNLDNLIKKSKILIFSAAPPGTPGFHHVNCREHEYWVKHFEALDFKFSFSLTEKCKQHSSMRKNFFKRWGYVFINKRYNEVIENIENSRMIHVIKKKLNLIVNKFSKKYLKIKKYSRVKSVDFKILDNDTLDLRKREFLALKDYIKTGKNLIGIELGVFKGDSLNFLSRNIKQLEWHGFDSFEGLPENWDIGPNVIHKERFKTDLKKLKFYNSKIHKGWFKDTVPEFIKKDLTQQKKISFINFDCDLFSSTYETLIILNKHIVADTILRFDDFCDWRDYFPNNMRFRRKLYTKWPEHQFKALNLWKKNFGRFLQPVLRNSFSSMSYKVIK